MEFILVSVLLAAVFAFIAYPILKPPQLETNEPDALGALTTQRDSAYQSIRDLDFDYQLGKLSATDYAALRERYVSRVAAALQQIDAAAQEPTTQRAETAPRCGNCGTPHAPDDKFCRRCGNKLG